MDIHRELTLSVSELEYFPGVENIEISLYAQARQSLLLLTQGNIYNRLRFLNKYLMFLEQLNELFRENWSKFLSARYLVFCKHFPAAGYLDTSYNYSLYLLFSKTIAGSCRDNQTVIHRKIFETPMGYLRFPSFGVQ